MTRKIIPLSAAALLALVSLTALTALSCATEVTVPDDITAAELVQEAQEASDRNRTAQALRYYEIILERFPEDMEYVCTAEYEIAFIQYKKKKYDEAELGFTNLLARYEGPEEELLPSQFKILSEKILAKIEESKKK